MARVRLNSRLRLSAYVSTGLLGLGLLAWVYNTVPLIEWIDILRQWILSFGMAGVALFAVLYIAVTLALGPVSGLNLMAGLAYGFWGFPLVVICATLGASVAFLLGRYLAHARINSWIAGKPKLSALQRAVSEEGWRVVWLVRLSPVIPFGLQNYLFSVTHIGFAPFVLATLIGVMPALALYVYVGSLGQEIGNAGMLQWVLVAVGLAATLLVAWVVGKRATQVLERQAQTDNLERIEN